MIKRALTILCVLTASSVVRASRPLRSTVFVGWVETWRFRFNIITWSTCNCASAYRSRGPATSSSASLLASNSVLGPEHLKQASRRLKFWTPHLAQILRDVDKAFFLNEISQKVLVLTSHSSAWVGLQTSDLLAPNTASRLSAHRSAASPKNEV